MRYFLTLAVVVLAVALAHAPVRADEPGVRPAARVKAYVKRDLPPKTQPVKVPTQQCLGPVKVVGSQALNEGGAEESAIKAWAEHVRWEHGEAFMDVGRSRNYKHRCARSSIGEIAGQVFYRCEISADPCKPLMVEGK